MSETLSRRKMLSVLGLTGFASLFSVSFGGKKVKSNENSDVLAPIPAKIYVFASDSRAGQSGFEILPG